MVLLLLDHDRDGIGTLDRDVEQGMPLGENHTKVAAGRLEGDRLTSIGIDDARDLAGTAKATAAPGAEIGSGMGCEVCSI
jgi:hypothetical protein